MIHDAVLHSVFATSHSLIGSSSLMSVVVTCGLRSFRADAMSLMNGGSGVSGSNSGRGRSCKITTGARALAHAPAYALAAAIQNDYSQTIFIISNSNHLRTVSWHGVPTGYFGVDTRVFCPFTAGTRGSHSLIFHPQAPVARAFGVIARPSPSCPLETLGFRSSSLA